MLSNPAGCKGPVIGILILYTAIPQHTLSLNFGQCCSPQFGFGSVTGKVLN